MEKERREKMALTLAYKKTQIYPLDHLSIREQNSVAGQLMLDGKQMFPGKKGKKEFASFLERCKTGNFVEGDGEIAVALILFNHRRKLKEEGEIHSELTEEQAVELLTDKEYAPLDFTMSEKLEFAQFVNWLKQVAYKKITRNGK